jgi:hypothetical protein
MSKILSFTHIRKNISIVFAATYLALSCSIAQAASPQSTSSSHHLDLKSTVAEAESQCTRWNVGKRFTAIQNNTSTPILFDLIVQYGGKSNEKVIGTARYENVFGQVTKSSYIDGSSLYMEIKWNNGPTGVYTAEIDDRGYLSGETYDLSNPSSTASWAVRQRFKCLK